MQIVQMVNMKMYKNATLPIPPQHRLTGQPLWLLSNLVEEGYEICIFSWGGGFNARSTFYGATLTQLKVSKII